jgi:hypothetical protein
MIWCSLSIDAAIDAMNLTRGRVAGDGIEVEHRDM